MDAISFESLKSQIQNAVQNKITAGVISDSLGFILIDGFINLPIQKEVGGAFVIGGPTIPAIGVVGKSSGLIYTFALKALLPNIQL